MAPAIPFIALGISAIGTGYTIYSTETAKAKQQDTVDAQNAAIQDAANKQNKLIDQQLKQNLDALGVTTQNGTTAIDPNADPNSTAAGQVKRQGEVVQGNLNAQAGAAGVIGGENTSAGASGTEVAATVNSQLQQVIDQANGLQTKASALKDINTTNAKAGVAANSAGLDVFNAQANAQEWQSIFKLGNDTLSVISSSYKPSSSANEFGVNANSVPGSANGFVYGTQNKPDWMY